MKLKEIFDVLPDKAKVNLIWGEISLTGTSESMSIMLADEIADCSIQSVEARDDVIWIWIGF